MRPEDRKRLQILTPEQINEKVDNALEKELQKHCENWLRQNQIEFLHMSFRAHEKIGWPDLVFANPFDGGRFYAVELKAKHGIVKPEQHDCLYAISSNGGKSKVIRSFEEFLEFVKGVSE